MSTDFTVQNEGSIFILNPITEAADAWVEEKIPITDETQFWGKGIVVEHRYIIDLVDGIRSDDLTVEAA